MVLTECQHREKSQSQPPIRVWCRAENEKPSLLPCWQLVRTVKNTMENTQFGDLITINQGAELLGVHPNTIRNLISRKLLVAERIGARIIRIRKQRLLELLTPYEAGEFGVWRCNRQSDAADPRPRRDPILGGGSL
jgi:excisionase family DNA binding protein